ncbi:MAG: GH3 auxin-responsive promoter family protein [Planctomycetes bacterium]|nr:GH3 auxin-responsive promoter family protein [Planctomycetota bacterium]
MKFRSVMDRLVAAVGRGVVIPWYAQRFRKFERRLQRLRDIQQQMLFERVHRFRDTRFGRDHRFGEIHSVGDFRRNVPIGDYSQFAPYIDAVARGDLAALIPPNDRLLRFTTTTGTTGVPKLNPVTEIWMREYTQATDLWNIKLILDHPEVVGRKILHLTGTWDMGTTQAGWPISMVSALASRQSHPMVRQFFAVPFEVSAIPDPIAKYYTILRLSVAQNIGVIIAIAPGTVLRLAEIGNTEAQTLIRDLHDGTLSSRFEIPGAIRERLQPVVGRSERPCARRLEQIISQSGHLYPRDYWPHPVIGCWLGGTAGMQSRKLPDYFGNSPLRDLGLVSSEGRHTIPVHDHDTLGILAGTTNYYEFIPLDERGSARPEALEAHELEVDRDYSLVMTTSSGYFRYEIGDIVRCRGYVGEAPLLEFLQKMGRCSDLEGEKLTEHQVAQAVHEAATSLGVHAGNVTAVPCRPAGGKPRYVLLADHNDFPDAARATQFLIEVDSRLAQANFLYRGARHAQVLAPLQLRLLSEGAWNEYALTVQRQRGTGDAQYKHPALVSDSKLLENLGVSAVIDMPQRIGHSAA